MGFVTRVEARRDLVWTVGTERVYRNVSIARQATRLGYSAGEEMSHLLGFYLKRLRDELFSDRMVSWTTLRFDA